eukprot:m.160945 g.160945  ORF g.160945 m.160945 type:complete len:740 (+) comp12009_c0_seq1:35-2254(+)
MRTFITTAILQTVLVTTVTGQATPQLTASGPNITVQTGSGGYFTLNGDTIATEAVVTNGLNNLGDDAAITSAMVSTLQADYSNSMASITALQTNVQQCTESGQLYNAALGSCVAPTPNSSLWATADRVNSTEGQIDLIETVLQRLGEQLQGTGGNHTFCSICSVNKYVRNFCSVDNQTDCADCDPTSWSRGGYAEQCLPCSTQVTNCETARCSGATGAICSECLAVVEGGAAYVVNATTNQCQLCGSTTYRSAANTCTACPKDNSCATATCQADSVVTQLSGVPSVSSVYTPALNGITMAQYLARYNDGVTGFNPLGIHTGTNRGAGELVNPFLQVNYTLPDGNNPIGSINRFVFYNRPGNCGFRSLNRGTGCGRNLATNNGAIFGVSDTALVAPTSNAVTSTFPTAFCSSLVTTNCICGQITSYIATSNGIGPYVIQCPAGVTGKYAFIGLNGTERMLNFGELEIWGSYSQYRPKPSTCTQACVMDGCLDGQASCSGDLSTATCSTNGCTTDVVASTAYYYDNGQCVTCAANTYLSDVARGTCTACPGGCACQKNSSVLGGTATHGPNQWRQLVASRARDTNPLTYSETGTATNPWFQLNMTGSFTIASVDITNRPDRCGSRLYNPGNNTVPQCLFDIPVAGSQYDRDYNSSIQGATVKVSNTPCNTTVTAAGVAQICPGTVCGRITRPSTTGRVQSVTCPAGTTGTYVNVQLPGARRILQIADLKVNQDTTTPASCT